MAQKPFTYETKQSQIVKTYLNSYDYSSNALFLFCYFHVFESLLEKQINEKRRRTFVCTKMECKKRLFC